MNIPVGEVVEQHKPFSEIAPFKRLEKLLDSDFDGYFVATIEGISGLEEGLLLIKEKKILGAVFDPLRINKQVYGPIALRLVFNLLKAKKGVFDLNKLSRQQIDLIIAFNDRITLLKPVEKQLLSKLEPGSYQGALVSKILELEIKSSSSRHNLLKKLGLGSI